jgi:O-antigen/teichoic acid export membrane protein
MRAGLSLAVGMGITNVATYLFQVLAARILGPSEYGGVAGLTALLMVIAVLQLGLQATAARRISTAPGQVAQIEHVILRVTYRAALVLGAVMLLASPLVMVVLRLDSLLPAVLLAAAAVPLTIQGGQAGILQGERRWQALALLYLAVGVPRVVIGSLCILWQPTATGAMFGIMLGLLAPALVGWFALRRGRVPGERSDEHAVRPIIRETILGSLALLAFFVLSNIDIVVARNVLSLHEAGLYAGGLILTKAVLFLPQFVVVVAFPSMSTAEERRVALLRSLALVMALGLACTAGALVLPQVAMVFVGGAEYADVESRLWMFAVLGTLLSMLQLLVYSVLARQGTRSTFLVGAAVAALLAASLWIDTLGELVATVIVIDASLFATLLALSLWRMRVLDQAPAPPTVSV